MIFETMGTTVSITCPNLPARATMEVRETFRRYDLSCSLWIADSEASQFSRGEITLDATSGLFRDAFLECEAWEAETRGAFTPRIPTGGWDVQGIAKALAIRAAGQVLESYGATNWLINAGGDIATSGTRADGQPWTSGIVDPEDRSRLVSRARLDGRVSALATSGTAERGEHIWRALGPIAGGTAAHNAAFPQRGVLFSQVSVAARDIVTADVWATAIMSGGPATLGLAAQHDVEVLAFSPTAGWYATPMFREDTGAADAVPDSAPQAQTERSAKAA